MMKPIKDWAIERIILVNAHPTLWNHIDIRTQLALVIFLVFGA